MSIQDLKAALKKAVDTRIFDEAKAKRGVIKNGRFHFGAKSYPFKQAVDCSLSGKVWAQLTKNNTAIIIGA